MAVSLAYALKADVTETLETNVDAANNPSIVHSKYSLSGTLNATSSVPATKVVAGKFALTAGARTLDLTNLVGTNGATVNGTGLKVQSLLLRPRGPSAMTFSQGAANPYQFGGANWSIRRASGQAVMLLGNDQDPDIAGGAKNIDVAGVGTEEFEMVIVMG